MSAHFPLIIILSIIAFLVFTNCRSVPKRDGDESLVEARIQSAVNAERARWIAGLSADIERGLSEVDQRVSAVGTGLQAIRTAAEEYRRFVLSLIDRLHQSETDVQGNSQLDGQIDNRSGGVDSSETVTRNTGFEISDPG